MDDFVFQSQIIKIGPRFRGKCREGSAADIERKQLLKIWKDQCILKYNEIKESFLENGNDLPSILEIDQLLGQKMKNFDRTPIPKGVVVLKEFPEAIIQIKRYYSFSLIKA